MKYAIASGHHLTSQAAEEILRAGGNAMDAAIAAFAASFVTEPAMAAPGGGAFAMVYPVGKEPLCFDFFCQTPANKIPKEEAQIFPIDVDFGGEQETFYGGLGTVAVPGSISGIYAIHKKFGSIPMKEALQPAINLAKEGVELNWFQHLDLHLLKDVFGASETGRKIAFKGDEPKEIGDKMFMEQLADFLDALGREGEELFYKGEVGQSLIKDCVSSGGHLTMKDLESYQTGILKPDSLIEKDRTTFTFPVPSLGGRILHSILRNIAGKATGLTFRSEKQTDILYRALKIAERIRTNPEFMKGGVYNPGAVNLRGSTSHISVVDNQGNAVALTTTIGEGSGYYIPGTMVHMNNMLGEPFLLPNGLNSWTENTRLPSMMSPSITINNQGYPQLVMGTGGAGRIPFILPQIWHNCLELGMDLDPAIHAPRMHFTGHTLHLEDCQESPVEPLLDDRIVCWDKKSLYFGGVHAVYSPDGENYQAVGDSRRQGHGLTSGDLSH